MDEYIKTCSLVICTLSQVLSVSISLRCESSYVPDALRLLFLSFPTLCALALLFYHCSEVSPKPIAPFPFSYLRLSPLSFLISAISPFGFLLLPPTPIFSPIPTSAASLSHRCFGPFLSHLRSPPFPRSPHSLRTVGTLRSAFPTLAPLFPRTVRTLSRSLHRSSHSIVVTLHCSLVTVTPPNSI